MKGNKGRASLNAKNSQSPKIATPSSEPRPKKRTSSQMEAVNITPTIKQQKSTPAKKENQAEPKSANKKGQSPKTPNGAAKPQTPASNKKGQSPSALTPASGKKNKKGASTPVPNPVSPSTPKVVASKNAKAQNNKAPTPSPKTNGKQNNKNKQGSNQVEVVAALSSDTRKSRLLFVRNFPSDTTPEIIKALDPKIVKIEMGFRLKRKGSKKYAFLEFATEKDLSNAHQKLQNKEVGGRKLYVDFCDERGKKVSKRVASKNYTPDLKKLIVDGFDEKMDEQVLKTLYPSACKIDLPQKRKKLLGFAFIHYKLESDAKNALEKSQGKTYSGVSLHTEYARVKIEGTVNKKDEPPQKKAKVVETKKKEVANAKKTKKQAPPQPEEDDESDEDDVDMEDMDDDDDDDSDGEFVDGEGDIDFSEDDDDDDSDEV